MMGLLIPIPGQQPSRLIFNGLLVHWSSNLGHEQSRPMVIALSDTCSTEDASVERVYETGEYLIGSLCRHALPVFCGSLTFFLCCSPSAKPTLRATSSAWPRATRGSRFWKTPMAAQGISRWVLVFRIVVYKMLDITVIRLVRIHTGVHIYTNGQKKVVKWCSQLI